MSGSELAGYTVTITLDERSKDQTKVHVRGLPGNMHWSTLKQAFGECGKGKGNGKAASAGGSGEVRFDTPMSAQNALMHLNGSILNGTVIQIGLDERSQDGTKLCVNNLAAGTSWQDLKDHFGQAGQVAFAQVRR